MALYVTDTHPVVWFVTGQRRKLSKTALRIFEDANRQHALVYVPAAVFWEISILLRVGRVSLPQPLEIGRASCRERV